MPDRYVVANLVGALRERAFPSVVVWNRVEGRPRTREFDRSLRAEVRDPLWMLTRQWQVGEFRGDDAGSPISLRMRLDAAPLTGYRAHDHPAEPFVDDVPLEAKVERRPVTLVSGGRDVALELRLLMGRHWLKLVPPATRGPFLDVYAVHDPDPDVVADADRTAHPEVWQTFAAAAGRLMDGGALYLYLTGGAGRHAYDGVAVDPGDHGPIDDAATRFLDFFGRLFAQPPPDDDGAWVPERLEYQFACSAPIAGGGERVLVAEEYARGEIDWHDFDRLGDGSGLGAPVPPAPEGTTISVLPTPVKFQGMPDTRWWAFEDRTTNLGQIDAATTDVAKLLFAEFALVFANDWMVVPCTLDAGSVAQVRGIAIDTVFGERFWIEPAPIADAADRRWTAFTLAVEGGGEDLERTLLLLPTAPKVQEGRPAEDVLMIRDELANMVWGVERAVPLADGSTKRGAEAAYETRRWFEAELEGRIGPPAPPADAAAPIRYTAMTQVPENWIPFVPVHVPGSSREMQLQRGSLPRILEGDPDPTPAKVKPLTALLREGLDDAPARAYFLHEEEVPRAGSRVLAAYRRARARDGRALVWLGIRRESGRGEGSSGLAFDQLTSDPGG